MAVTLFEDKQNCCGCGACMNACSHNAITMVEDEYGFVYPRVNTALCVDCGICRRACGYQNPPMKATPAACYAAVAKDEVLFRASSSGGVFPVLAVNVLERGGVVYGASMLLEDTGFSPKHLRISQKKDLPLLQGSKYVQSDLSFTYRQAKEDLQNGKQVLYSGTPCQIAGLLQFLGREYDNLLTMEVICHGVPNARMFRDFIAGLEGKKQKKVTGFAFRSKEKDQGKIVCIEYCGASGSKEKTLLGAQEYSYMCFFQNACISRESCYTCPFAEEERVADLTVGDFWGFWQEHPNVSARAFAGNGTGVSCILANTEKGLQIIRDSMADFVLVETGFEKVARHNDQLSRPCRYSRERDELLRMYRQGGYPVLEAYFQSAYKRERFVQRIISQVPGEVRRSIKRAKGWIYKLSSRITE